MARKKAPVAPRSLRRRQAELIRSSGEIDIVRHKGAYTAFGYRSASEASRDGRSGVSASGDTHQEWDRERLIAQARDFQRNNGIFSGMVERATAYVVGPGFTLQAGSDDANWNAAAEALWASWWELPEVKGILSGCEVEAMVCSELMTCGDVGVIKTIEGYLQMVEAEQIVGVGKNRSGIKKDRLGRPLSFNVAPWPSSGAPAPASGQEVAAKDFLFLTSPKRPSQTRSVPPLQAVFSMLHRINDVCDSEAAAWQLLSRLALSVTRPGATLAAFQESTEDTSLSADEVASRLAARITELDAAIIYHGEPGDEVKGIERNVPGKDFPQSISMFCRLLGLPLGLPLEIVMLDWTKSNYSQTRAVLEQAYVMFNRWQKKLTQFFLTPVYRWWLGRMISDRMLPMQATAFKHDWIRPSFPWIDQLKEAEAYGKKLDRSFCTHAQVLKSQGLEREEVVAARRREIEDAIAIAKEIKTATGTDVPWQQFAGLEVPTSLPMPTEEPADEEPKEGAEEEEAAEAKAKALGVEKTVYRDPRGNILRVVERPYTGEAKT